MRVKVAKSADGASLPGFTFTRKVILQARPAPDTPISSRMTEKILAVLFVFIKSVIAATGYGGLAMLMAIESACIPLPSELIMPFAGYLVYEGTMKLFWVATAGAIGCNLGRWSPTRSDATAAARWSKNMVAGFS